MFFSIWPFLEVANLDNWVEYKCKDQGLKEDSSGSSCVDFSASSVSDISKMSVDAASLAFLVFGELLNDRLYLKEEGDPADRILKSSESLSSLPKEGFLLNAVCV